MPTVDLEKATVESFSNQLQGKVLEPGASGYEDARTVWNGMIDERPSVVARCTGAADVIAAVNFARDLGLKLAVKGGGHNVAGKAVCDNGLMIDLSPMDSVQVDPQAQTTRVEGGATMADLDHETQAHGLAVPGGIISSTGVAGLTLGGGWGRLARKYGLTIDNLRSVKLVTADGSLVQASEDRNSDLFWALRGGGGNFGVVVSLEFDLHQVGPEILGRRLAYAYEDAAEALRFYREFAREVPNAASIYWALVQAPPDPQFPESVWGDMLLLFTPFYAGDFTQGRETLEPLLNFGEPVVSELEPVPYVEYQQLSDDLYPEGLRYYWKSNYFDHLPDGLIDLLLDHAADFPTPLTTIFVEHLGGAITQVDPSATAYPHRHPQFAITVSPAWTEAADDDEHIEWAREVYRDLSEYASQGVYVNVLSDEGEKRVREAYGDQFDRLRRVKSEWDPENLFRQNQNVEPAD